MAERAAEVVAVGSDGALLRVTGPCSDCGGCGGRCDLFRSDSHGIVQVSLSQFEATPVAGDAVMLTLPDGWLTRAALHGYGLPLAALLLGAALGHAAGTWLGTSADMLALLGAVLGTSAMLRVSNANGRDGGDARIFARRKVDNSGVDSSSTVDSVSPATLR